MHTDPFEGRVTAREYRRRRLLLLAGLIIAIAVIVVAVVRIGGDGEVEPNGPDGGDPATENGAPAGPGSEPGGEADSPESPAGPPTTTDPPTITEPPTTTTEPPTTTTSEPPPPTTTTTEPPPTTTTSEPPPPTTTTTEPPPPPPVALLTPAGIPVTVLEVLETGFLVRTPCGNTAEIAGGERIEPVRVVLDPGHGGPVETGTVGPNGLVERDLNLTLSEAVLAELDGRGIAAATTRTGNYMVRLGVRVEFADAFEPEALVSIHHNGPTWELGEVPGTEIYVQSGSDTGMRPESARLGGLLYEEIVEALSAFEDVQWSGLPDAGVKRVVLADGSDTYALVRGPKAPSALVEYGYLTNASEAEFFATEEYIAAAAGATAAAIEAFLESDRAGSGFIEEPRFYDPGGQDIDCTDPPLEPKPVDEPEEGTDGEAPEVAADETADETAGPEDGSEGETADESSEPGEPESSEPAPGE